MLNVQPGLNIEYLSILKIFNTEFGFPKEPSPESSPMELVHLYIAYHTKYPQRCWEPFSSDIFSQFQTNDYQPNKIPEKSPANLFSIIFKLFYSVEIVKSDTQLLDRLISTFKIFIPFLIKYRLHTITRSTAEMISKIVFTPLNVKENSTYIAYFAPILSQIPDREAHRISQIVFTTIDTDPKVFDIKFVNSISLVFSKISQNEAIRIAKIIFADVFNNSALSKKLVIALKDLIAKIPPQDLVTFNNDFPDDYDVILWISSIFHLSKQKSLDDNLERFVNVALIRYYFDADFTPVRESFKISSLNQNTTEFRPRLYYEKGVSAIELFREFHLYFVYPRGHHTIPQQFPTLLSNVLGDWMNSPSMQFFVKYVIPSENDTTTTTAPKHYQLIRDAFSLKKNMFSISDLEYFLVFLTGLLLGKLRKRFSKNLFDKDTVMNKAIDPNLVAAARKLIPLYLRNFLHLNFKDQTATKELTMHSVLLKAISETVSDSPDQTLFFLSSWKGNEIQQLPDSQYLNLPDPTISYQITSSFLSDPLESFESVIGSCESSFKINGVDDDGVTATSTSTLHPPDVDTLEPATTTTTLSVPVSYNRIRHVITSIRQNNETVTENVNLDGISKDNLLSRFVTSPFPPPPAENGNGFILGSNEKKRSLNLFMLTRHDRGVVFKYTQANSDPNSGPTQISLSSDEFLAFENKDLFSSHSLGTLSGTYSSGPGLFILLQRLLPLCFSSEPRPRKRLDNFLSHNFLSLLKLLRTFSCIQGPNGVEFYTYYFDPTELTSTELKGFATNLWSLDILSYFSMVAFFSKHCEKFYIKVSKSTFQNPESRIKEITHYNQRNTEILVYLYSYIEPLLHASAKRGFVPKPLSLKPLLADTSKTRMRWNLGVYNRSRDYSNTPFEIKSQSIEQDPDNNPPPHYGFHKDYIFEMPNIHLTDLVCVHQNLVAASRIYLAQIKFHKNKSLSTAEGNISGSTVFVKEYFLNDSFVSSIYPSFLSSLNESSSPSSSHICRPISCGFVHVSPDILRDSETAISISEDMGYSTEILYRSYSYFVVLPRRVAQPVCTVHGFSSLYCSCATFSFSGDCCFTENDVVFNMPKGSEFDMPRGNRGSFSCRCVLCHKDNKLKSERIDKGPFCSSFYTYMKMILDAHSAILELLARNISFTDAKESNFVFNPETRCFEAIDYGWSMVFTDSSSTRPATFHGFSWTQKNIPFRNWYAFPFQHFRDSLLKCLPFKILGTDDIGLVLKARSLNDYLSSKDIVESLAQISSMETATSYVEMIYKITEIH